MENKGFGVSVRGQFHRANKIPNQDYFRVVNNKDYLLAVVCDGLGSKKFSHYASKRLSNLVVKEINAAYKNKALKPIEFLTDLKEKFLQKISPFNLDNCDTTLQVMLIVKGSVLIMKIGDGLIALKGNETSIFEEEEDNFANETISFGRSNVTNWMIKKINLKDNEKIKAILCTDGIAGDLLHEEIGNFIDELSLQKPYIIKKMLKNWPNKHSQDDKTIVVVK